MKELIRQDLRIARAAHQGVDDSRKIKEILFSFPIFKKSKKVLFYMPINNEVDTHQILRESGKAAYVPVTDVDANRLLIARAGERFIKGPFNVPEPEEKVYVEPSLIDLVILPGIAFDRRGGRLGYGRGFYDILLNEMRATKIALAYSFQVVDKVPQEEHDVKMDYIITEKEVIAC